MSKSRALVEALKAAHDHMKSIGSHSGYIKQQITALAGADRVIACEDACAGMDDPAKEIAVGKSMERAVDHAFEVIDRIVVERESLRAQRDELAAALHNTRAALAKGQP